MNLTTAQVTATSTLVAAKPWGANASYDFGVAKATLGYVDTNRTGTTSSTQATAGKGYVAKVNVPMGNNALFAGYAKNSTTRATAYELGDYYSLSKRTKLYAVYGNGSDDMSTSAKTNGKRIGVGVTHDF